MSRRRVLVLGVTGIEKKAVLERLSEWYSDHHSRECRFIDFDKDELFPNTKGGGPSYLDDSLDQQVQQWSAAWDQFWKGAGLLKESRDVFLGLHGCIVRGHYGVRSPVDLARVRQFDPHLIVTLLDDVFDMWWRTEKRAGGMAFHGMPTLEQLLLGRRVELMIAEQIAHLGQQGVPHFALSVAHPCETLGNRVCHENPYTVYLCFPISAPRKLAKNGDSAGVEDVNRFLKAMYELQSKTPNLVVTCPLGIDELPLLGAMEEPSLRVKAKRPEAEVEAVNFPRDERRWCMDACWDPEQALSVGPPGTPDRAPIPVEQIEDAAGLIHTDVSWRDYRLIEQAQTGCLAVFNPWFRGKTEVSRSVHNEIIQAHTRKTPCFVFQDPAHHDREEVVRTLRPPAGTMVSSTATTYVRFVDSLAELVETIRKEALKVGKKRQKH